MSRQPGAPGVPGLERVAVVGAGLIGGSVALRLRDLGVAVSVVDPDPATRGLATRAGLDAHAAVDDLPAPTTYDLVVLAGPLDRLGAAMEQVARGLPAALVVDVGSVKTSPGEAALEAGLSERYVGCHPMAGTERSGFDGADAQMLVGATWAVVRPRPAHPAAVQHLARVVRLLVAAFEAQVVVLDADAHDRAVALVSHAPHVLANVMLGLVERSGDGSLARHLAAGSFADLTRVAGTNPTRTLNMLADNAGPLAGVLDELVELLSGYRDDLDRPRAGALGARLEQVADGATRIRRPEPAWTPCDDLDAVLRDSDGADASDAAADLLVRAAVGGGLETADATG